MFNKEEFMSTEESTVRFYRTYTLGEINAINLIIDKMKDESSYYFNNNKDEIANILRNITKKLIDKSNELGNYLKLIDDVIAEREIL